MHGRDLIRHLSMSKSSLFFLFLQMIGVLLIAWSWAFRLPPPGYAVAVLAFVAAAMTFQEDMRGWQKAIWLLLIGGLLAIEMKAIRMDRKIAACEALKDRAAQDQHFTEIRRGQDADFKTVTEGFSKTLAQNEKEFSATQRALEATLKAANITLKQTLPYAQLHVTRTELEPRGADLAIGQLILHVFVINDGNQNASNITVLTKAYVPDKSSDIKQTFENDWKTLAKKMRGDIPPHQPLQMLDTSIQFSDKEMTDILQGTKAIVYITRIAYSDSTGKWFSDNCSLAFPRLGKPHVCSYLNDQRYEAPVDK
jgi:hypothetical protein